VYGIVDNAKHRGRQPIDQPIRSLGDGLEYWLHIVRRTGDDLKNFGSGDLAILGVAKKAF
jgi:hypothetical protein